MSEVNMSATDILDHMKKGAKLHRAFADKIELRLHDKVVLVPVDIFDSLIDERRIVPEGGAAGYYRAA